MAKLINIAADADALRLDRHHYQAFIGILTAQGAWQVGGVRFQMADALNMKNTRGSAIKRYKKEEDLLHLRHLLILNQSKLDLATLLFPLFPLSLPL